MVLRLYQDRDGHPEPKYEKSELARQRAPRRSLVSAQPERDQLERP